MPSDAPSPGQGHGEPRLTEKQRMLARHALGLGGQKPSPTSAARRWRPAVAKREGLTKARGRYFCVRHLPPTNGARCSLNCGVGDGADHKPACAFVRDRLQRQEEDRG